MDQAWIRRRRGGGFSPRSLVSGSTMMAWYDPSDLSTLFQDSAGTTPVTASGQPVGKMNDKSGNGLHMLQATSAKRPTYTTSGGLHFLDFDGTDDAMSVASVVPGADKAQIFAGVRKDSDTGGIIAELSVNAGSNAGSFYLVGGNDTGIVGSVNGYTAAARGSAPLDSIKIAQIANAAPDTSVLAATHDISGDLSTIRRDTVAGTNATGDKGTGNFLTYPLYIGGRGGTSVYFNGALFGLIVRFSTSNMAAAQIAQTETWINSKTGGY